MFWRSLPAAQRLGHAEVCFFPEEEEDVCPNKKGNFCYRVHESLIICLVLNFLENCLKINSFKEIGKNTFWKLFNVFYDWLKDKFFWLISAAGSS